ncbi:UNVERIFIED_CONTAM: hypothetical protein NCL1_46606 [Trichonephila clavipes]
MYQVNSIFLPKSTKNITELHQRIAEEVEEKLLLIYGLHCDARLTALFRAVVVQLMGHQQNQRVCNSQENFLAHSFRPKTTFWDEIPT